MSCKVAYLVSHRALARQKYLELRRAEMLDIFQLDPSQLVMATGDEVIDGTGEPNRHGMDATFVIATYEKFLAMLARGGPRRDMSHYCVVADEIQLLGDDGRGQDIEILLTLIKTAGYGQFAGLSAVLHKQDRTNLADWLGLDLVEATDREVPLTLELRTPKRTYVTRFGERNQVEERAPERAISSLGILRQLSRRPKEHCPIAVFCMTKARVEALAKAWAREFGTRASASASAQLELFDELTSLSNDLLLYVDNEFGIHTADLLEAERALVEDRLDRDQLTIVFATTTLAQGLNYSFQTVVFDRWWRWNSDKRAHFPIPRADFHNMAGRAGRLGRAAEGSGRAIFSAELENARAAYRYLSSDTERVLTGKIDPALFDLVALQVSAAGVVDTEESLMVLLEQTLSAHVERLRKRSVDTAWRRELSAALDNLNDWGFIRLSKKIVVTELGRTIAHSGLLPGTAHYFFDYFRTHVGALGELLPAPVFDREGFLQGSVADQDNLDIAFILAHLCFTSPEFGGGGVPARRRLPYQLDVWRESARAERLDSLLAVRPWDFEAPAVNATDLTLDWISGLSIIGLEKQFDGLRAGVLNDMYRTLVGYMRGMADILAGMIVASDAGQLGWDYAWVPKRRAVLLRIVRRALQVARSAGRGVPEEMLWLAELKDSDGRPLCRRPEVVACWNRGLRTVEQVMDAGRTTHLMEALKAADSSPHRWKTIRTGIVDYRSARTERRKTGHALRLERGYGNPVAAFCDKRGIEFEKVLEGCFRTLGIKVLGRDGPDQRGRSYPDFVIELAGRKVVVECKSCEGTMDIPLREASEVFRKAAIHHLEAEPLVTVCQPYVATDVPRKIESSGRLTVVNAEDLAEALVRLHAGRLNEARFLNWLTTPGQARSEELV